MYKNNPNRSILAMAGSQSLGSPHKLTSNQMQQSIVKPFMSSQMQSSFNNLTQQQKMRHSKKILVKLTLPRLRKMQALVRGFLVRRKIYPKELQDYLVAQGVLDLLIANSIYKQASQIVLEAVTFPKYQQHSNRRSLIGEEGILQKELFNRIYAKAMHDTFKEIIQEASVQRAVYYSRPKITFGFNLRSPEQLLLYDILINHLSKQGKQIAQQAIQQQAIHKQQLLWLDQIIQNHQLLDPILFEIVQETLNQSMAQYLVQQMYNRVVQQGAQVCAIVSYNEEKNKKQQSQLTAIQQQVTSAIVQQGVLSAILSLNYGKN